MGMKSLPLDHADSRGETRQPQALASTAHSVQGKNPTVTFQTDYHYTDRENKAKYVWLKYQPVLTDRVLAVGADEYYRRWTFYGF